MHDLARTLAWRWVTLDDAREYGRLRICVNSANLGHTTANPAALSTLRLAASFDCRTSADLIPPNLAMRANGKAHRRGRTERKLRAASVLVAQVVVEDRIHSGLVRVQRDVSLPLAIMVTMLRSLSAHVTRTVPV